MLPDFRWMAVLAVSAACLAGVGQAPASADSADGSANAFSESEFDNFSRAEVAAALTDATTPQSRAEASAVDAYLADQPAQGSFLTPSDLEVGTLALSNEVSATVVAPEAGVDVRTISLIGDAGADTVSAGAQVDSTTDTAQTAGPGMGSWPSWSDAPSWVVQLRVYVSNNFIGKAEFQTQRRKYTGDGWVCCTNG